MALARTAPKLTPEQYQANFEEVVPAMNAAEALAESSRCLFCYDAPCTLACPTHIDVPAFIKKIQSGNLRGSARVIYQANLFGGSCARVCPVEVLCEGACVFNEMDQRPIQIARLQRHATDHLINNRRAILPKLPENGKRVAAVGAGPAGLAFAGEAARYGYQAVVFDGRELPGGLNTYAMADYKMSAQVSVTEAKMIQELGVEIRNGVWVGKDVTVSELLEEFDAVFLGPGLGATYDLGIPGEDLEGSVDALSFIEELKLKPRDEVIVGNRVAVIGAGNSAIDAVTQARRLGAEEAYLVYRRTPKEMPAYEYEYDFAKGDEVRFHWLSRPVRIEGNGRVERLVCEKMRLGEPDASGRASVEGTGEEFTLEVDMVIRALGQQKRKSWFSEVDGLELERDGRVKVSAEGATSVSHLYAGGDCINGGKEAVNAVADGKRSARAVYLSHFGSEPSIP